MRYAEANLFQRLNRTLPSNPVVARVYSRILPAIDRSVFRLTRGRHSFVSVMTGLPLILLETTGARSGQARAAPVIGIHDGLQGVGQVLSESRPQVCGILQQ